MKAMDHTPKLKSWKRHSTCPFMVIFVTAHNCWCLHRALLSLVGLQMLLSISRVGSLSERWVSPVFYFNLTVKRWIMDGDRVTTFLVPVNSLGTRSFKPISLQEPHRERNQMILQRKGCLQPSTGCFSAFLSALRLPPKGPPMLGGFSFAIKPCWFWMGVTPPTSQHTIPMLLIFCVF